MFTSLSSALGAARDKAVESVARSFLNRKIETFGQITRLEIDSGHKNIFLEATLKGEASPVAVHITAYELSQRDADHYFTVTGIDSSREWVTAAANQYLVGRPIKIPEAVRFAL